MYPYTAPYFREGMDLDLWCELSTTFCRDSLTLLLKNLHQVDFAGHLARLRPGHIAKFTIPDDHASVKRGGCNIHFEVEFEDGVKWMMRVRMPATLSDGYQPLAMRQMEMESEVLTVRAMTSVGVPVPAVYGDVVVEGDLTYFCMEYIPNVDVGPAPVHSGHQGWSDTQLKKYVRQLASAYLKISELRFDKVGSLHKDSSGGTIVGPFFSRHMEREVISMLGPCSSSIDKYVAQFTARLSALERGTSVEDTHPARSYLILLWLRDLLKSLDLLDRDEDIMMLHPDTKGDNFLADKDGNMVCMADWESSHTASKSDAFAPPMCLVDIPTFFDGSNDLSVWEEEFAQAFENASRPDLADCVRKGKIYQRVLYSLHSEVDVAMLLAIERAAHVYMSDPKPSMDADGTKPISMEQWCAKVRETYKDDPILQRLEAEQGAGEV